MGCGAVLSGLLAVTLAASVVRAGLPEISILGARCFSELRCDPATEISFGSVRECCMDRPQGRSYFIPSIEVCGTCIVYGWLNATSGPRVVQEAGPGMRFEVGFIKFGSPPPLPIVFTISDVEGTAKRGSGRDYTVTNTGGTITSESTDAATVIIRVDGVALERNETFQLKLEVESPPTGDVFCIDILDVVIQDSDDVDIQLTEDDYRDNEANLNIGFIVSKDARIATNVSLSVTPVVVSEARRLNLFPVNVEQPDNLGGRSPVDADLNDFDNTVLTLTFQADEDDPTNEIRLQVPITDDAINEANEQDFVVILNVTDTVNRGGIVISRESSLCRIIDNDPIMIGFEREINTFPEPMFEQDEFIYLAKENNVSSEQTFNIRLQVTGSVPPGSGFEIAQFGQDYGGINVDLGGFRRTFAPNIQRLGILFTLLRDDDPEPTEAFQIISAPDENPTFNGPRTLFSQTFVAIEDDDIIVRIGFENTTYTVDEETGVQEVCVRVFVPDEMRSLDAEISAVVATAAGTADETDYTRLDADSLTVLLVFDNASRRVCFDVDISNDDLVEGSEEFTLILMEIPFLPPPIATVFNASMATVTILDRDEAVIGFLSTSYSAIESSENATLTFGLLSGGVQDNVNVRLELSDGSAQAGADFDNTGDVFTFDVSSTMTFSYDVPLVNDGVYEFIENFNAQLSFVGAAERVTINPGSAQVEVQDDDVVTFGFSPASYSEAETAGTVNLGASFLQGSFGDASISVQLSLDTHNDTAQGSPALEADYASIVGTTLEFSQSSRTQQVPVTIFEDNLTEDNETFVADLFDPLVLVGGVQRVLAVSEADRIRIQPDTAIVEITDNDETVIGFLEPEYSAFESQGAINFTIGVISGQLRIDAPFNFSTTDIVGSSNPAEAGTDYVPELGKELVFNSVVTGATVPVSLIDDGLFEVTEFFSGLLISTASLPSNVRLSPDVANGAILEEGAIVIGWEQLRYNTSETSRSVDLCASITSQAEIQLDPFTLNVQYMDISAVQNSDYTVPSASLSIGPFSRGSRRACVSVDITDDVVAENLESFSATLDRSSNSPSQLTISPATTTVDILDNDVIVIGWERTSYDTSENEDMVELCAVITSPALFDRDPFTLQVSCSPGSAAVGEDYQQCPSTIGPFDFGQIPPRACISVDINDDPVPEDPEDFIAVLQPSPDPLISVDPNQDQTTVNIIDNDVIELTLDPSPSVTVTETEGSVQICVQISSPPNSTMIQRRPFNVSISTMDGSATDPSDYSGINIVNQFGPFSNSMRRRCVTIPIVLDSVPETDEQFTVTADENVNGVAISVPMTTVTIVDSIRRVNDSVIGDPLMTIPVNLRNNSAIPKLGENSVLNLCFEVHGDADATFNLVSDGCVSVNAHYGQVRPTESQNIIDAVYIRAVDNAGVCHNIAVDLNGCSASVDGTTLSSMYSSMGVSVRPYSNRVRVAVPNCQELDLVMWVICQSRTFWSSNLGPDGQEITFNAEMIKFVIARGLNLQETSHGILGQFWNIQIEVSAFDISNPNQEYYTVTVHYPGQDQRSFLGMLWPLTWEYKEEYCLYTGNGQAGPLDKADAQGAPNDPVLEGEYFRYKVDSSFATNFEFTHFDETRCV